jgi:vacuolar-type H+-ATPase subunit H
LAAVRRKDRQDAPRPQGRSDLVDEAAERLATIVAAAERAAEQVIDDAETQARRTLADAEANADRIAAERLAALSETTDALAAQADSIRREAERLLEVLERTKADLGDTPTQDAPVEEPSRVTHLTAVAPIDGPEPAPRRAPQASPPSSEPKRGSAAGARLLATQMAVSGSSREEIEARLRSGFEIEDTTAILDAILGPEA